MTIRVDEHVFIVKKILSCILKKPMRLKDVWKQAIKDSAPINRTVTVFYWLRDNGYIKKVGEGHNDPYEITEKGRKFYECI